MRKILVALVVLGALLALPPLYYAAVPSEVPELPPADGRIAVSGNTSVAALARGRGPVVVLVHGLPGQALDWFPMMEPLAKRGHRVIAYSRVGYNRSDRRRNGAFTPDGSAADLLALISAEGLRDVTVVGWSYGGATAIRAALKDPTHIRRIVLVGSAGPWPDAPEDPFLFKLLFSDPVLRWVAAVPPAGRAVQGMMSQQAFSDEPIPEWWGPQLEANFSAPHTMETWREEGRYFEWNEELDPAPIDLPILVIHGDDDRLVPLSVGEHLAERAKRGQLVVLEGGSHMLPITRPERMAELVADFAAGRTIRP